MYYLTQGEFFFLESCWETIFFFLHDRRKYKIEKRKRKKGRKNEKKRKSAFFTLPRKKSTKVSFPGGSPRASFSPKLSFLSRNGNLHTVREQYRYFMGVSSITFPGDIRRDRSRSPREKGAFCFGLDIVFPFFLLFSET